MFRKRAGKSFGNDLQTKRAREAGSATASVEIKREGPRKDRQGKTMGFLRNRAAARGLPEVGLGAWNRSFRWVGRLATIGARVVGGLFRLREILRTAFLSRGVGSGPAERVVDGALKAFAETFLADPLQVASAVEEGFDDPRIPLRSRSFVKNPVDLKRRKPRTVRPAARHGVEGVGDREHARGQGDVVAGETVGIARSVERLVMMRDAGKQVTQLLQVGQNVNADPHVRLDLSKLLVGQRPPFFENLVLDADLADVVKQAHQVEVAAEDRVETELFSQPDGDASDALGMPRGIGVFGVDRGGERANHAEEQVFEIAVESGVGTLRGDQGGDRLKDFQFRRGERAIVERLGGDQPTGNGISRRGHDGEAARRPFGRSRIDDAKGFSRRVGQKGSKRVLVEVADLSGDDDRFARVAGNPGDRGDPKILSGRCDRHPLKSFGRVRYAKPADQAIRRGQSRRFATDRIDRVGRSSRRRKDALENPLSPGDQGSLGADRSPCRRFRPRLETDQRRRFDSRDRRQRQDQPSRTVLRVEPQDRRFKGPFEPKPASGLGRVGEGVDRRASARPPDRRFLVQDAHGRLELGRQAIGDRIPTTRGRRARSFVALGRFRISHERSHGAMQSRRSFGSVLHANPVFDGCANAAVHHPVPLHANPRRRTRFKPARSRAGLRRSLETVGHVGPFDNRGRPSFKIDRDEKVDKPPIRGLCQSCADRETPADFSGITAMPGRESGGWDETVDRLAGGWDLPQDLSRASDPNEQTLSRYVPVEADLARTLSRSGECPPLESSPSRNSRPNDLKPPARSRPESAAEPERAESRGESSPKERTKLRFPNKGEVVCGFRILSELGRGAFGRVYLAEQEGMANRRVALKATKAEGDEYRALARLQHAHIVPIHSVHDIDGMRLLCMPYLGGANLAQVLERADFREPTRQTGRGLIKALDEFEAKTVVVTSVSRSGGRTARPGTRQAGSNSSEATRIVDGSRAAGSAAISPVAGTALTRGIGGPSTVRAIFRRGMQSRLGFSAFSPIDRDEPSSESGEGGGDRSQPARRFLREASYIRAAIWIVARLAEGLEHAHSRGLLHRDLKPSNILIAADGTPMLLDFNLAADSAPGDDEGAVRALVGGTLPYMAPEHLDAFNPAGKTAPEAVNERADIYSLGLILFEMVAGKHPFDDPDPSRPLLETLRRLTDQRRAGAPSARAVNPRVSWGLDSILKKCLDPEADRRYARAGDFAEDLRRYLDDLPLRHAPEPSARERLAKFARRNPKLAGSSSVAAISIVLILSLLTAVWFIADNLASASARLKFQRFQDDFRESQLLMNTAGGPRSHLARGIESAERSLREFEIDREEISWDRHPIGRRLNPIERRTLREELAELILLDERARVLLSSNQRESVRRAALERAVRRLERAERIDPEPSGILFADRARYERALGLAAEAERDNARAAGNPPRTARDHALHGASLLARGRYDEAESELARAVALDPKRFWAWFALGLCHFSQNRFAESALDFSVCTVLSPEFAWPHLNRGLALARAGRLIESRAAFDRAVALNSRFVEALVNRALTCLELGDASQAVADLSTVVNLGRGEASILAARGEAYSRLGRRSAAARDFADALRSRPDDLDLLTARGFFRLRFEPPAAETDFRAVLARDPRRPRALLGLAHSAHKRDPSAALRLVNQCLAAEPNYADALSLRSLLLARLGDVSALADVDRLLAAPTPHRLYNAACAVSVLSRTTHDPSLIPRGLELLRRSFSSGYRSPDLATDPDLEALRRSPDYGKILLP